MEDPASVVVSFIASMHVWELEAAAEQRRARTSEVGSADGYATDKLQAVFLRHCTPRARERPQGRLAAPFFQRPPEYDPVNERVVAVSPSDGRTATVETERTAVLGGGRYRYTAHKVDNRWLLDSVKVLLDEQWVLHTL